MKGVEFAEVRDAIVRAFNSDDFDMFLFERMDFDRPVRVQDGPFKLVVDRVLRLAEQEGWDAILVAEVAGARPLKTDVKEVYRKYADGLIDVARQQRVEDETLKTLERYGLTTNVNLQVKGKSQLPAATPYARGLERTIKRHLEAFNPALWRERLFKLENRVCRVEVGNGAFGTGFLVGPDLVLTNHHVLKDVIAGESSDDLVRFRFDYRVLASGEESGGMLVRLAAADWKISYSELTPEEAADRPDASVPSIDQLDYALVRIERPIGSEPLNPEIENSPRRGWIEVPQAAQPLHPEMPLLILQHLQGGPLKLALDTDGVLEVNENGTRVRYVTNTEAGSSGSPCFDLRWNLVALHHYGDPTFKHAAEYNQGIPIQMIRERLKRAGKAAMLGGASP